VEKREIKRQERGKKHFRIHFEEICDGVDSVDDKVESGRYRGYGSKIPEIYSIQSTNQSIDFVIQNNSKQTTPVHSRNTSS